MKVGQMLVREVVCRETLVAQRAVTFARPGAAAGATRLGCGVVDLAGGRATEPDDVAGAEAFGAAKKEVEAEFLRGGEKGKG